MMNKVTNSKAFIIWSYNFSQVFPNFKKSVHHFIIKISLIIQNKEFITVILSALMKPAFTRIMQSRSTNAVNVIRNFYKCFFPETNWKLGPILSKQHQDLSLLHPLARMQAAMQDQ